MKRFAVGGLVVALATVLAGAMAFAGTGAKGGSPGPDDETRTLRFDVVFSPFNFLDLARRARRSETRRCSTTS